MTRKPLGRLRKQDVAYARRIFLAELRAGRLGKYSSGYDVGLGLAPDYVTAHNSFNRACVEAINRMAKAL